MYDVLPGATNLCEVYNLNPILRVDGEGSISMKKNVEDLRLEGHMMMALDGKEQWVVKDVPYKRYEVLLKRGMCFPFNIADIREEENARNLQRGESRKIEETQGVNSAQSRSNDGSNNEARSSSSAVKRTESIGEPTIAQPDPSLSTESNKNDIKVDRKNLATRLRMRKRRRVKVMSDEDE
ncbi:unnamed protein product [Agarophyton chilense]